MLRYFKSIPIVRQIARWCISVFLEGSIVPIHAGHAEGMLWRRRRRYINSYWTGDFEPAFQTALAAELKPGMTFFDLGANAGFYSLMARKLVGQEGKCVSVDPDPGNCSHMMDLKEINKIDNWVILQEAIAGEIGTAIFQTRDEGDPGGHLITLRKFTGENPQGQNHREVKSTTPDALIDRHGKPHVVKIDIEGAEWEAISQGSSRLLGEARPVILLEIHGNERAYLIREVFERHGYELLTLQGRPTTFESNDIFHVVARPK